MIYPTQRFLEVVAKNNRREYYAMHQIERVQIDGTDVIVWLQNTSGLSYAMPLVSDVTNIDDIITQMYGAKNCHSG